MTTIPYDDAFCLWLAGSAFSLLDAGRFKEAKEGLIAIADHLSGGRGDLARSIADMLPETADQASIIKFKVKVMTVRDQLLGYPPIGRAPS